MCHLVIALVQTRSPLGEVFFLISVHTTPFHFSRIKYHIYWPTWEPFSLLSTDNYPHVDSNSLASGDSSSPWFIEHMFRWPTTKSPITLHYIKLDLDGGPLLSFYVVAPDPSHSGRMAITEDAVPTAKLQWCKPFETDHTSTTVPEKSFPLLAWYGQLFTCQFKFTCKSR